MRKRTRRRPEVETLESMTLLSGITVAAEHPVAALAKTPSFPNPLILNGTLHGTLTAKGSSELLKASGNLKPIGKVSFSGSEPASTTGVLPSTLVVPVKTAKLFMSLNLKTTGTTATGTYNVTGGTKFLANERGSGNLTVTLLSISSPVKFTATFTPSS
jgi:hypothetical protein